MPSVKHELIALRLAAVGKRDFLEIAIDELRAGKVVQDVGRRTGLNRKIALLASVWMRQPFSTSGQSPLKVSYALMLRGMATVGLPTRDPRCKECWDLDECHHGNLCLAFIIDQKVDAAKELSEDAIRQFMDGRQNDLDAHIVAVAERLHRYREYARTNLARKRPSTRSLLDRILGWGGSRRH
ncbi:hypothetical protein [Magnetospirillum sp. UT-4]|uniref:hypothetical protein n=1 Tax=Magnetospirillum sp. UT-4 TaxID=2681467 RepID=UPI00137FB17C|nr:hypothetical protein [Magnetospirillum sp. UT-4]CAA7617582.1 hypothetical protein MTBUT4_260016 [Magnetospirillum sp. UT-4]